MTRMEIFCCEEEDEEGREDGGRSSGRTERDERDAAEERIVHSVRSHYPSEGLYINTGPW